MSAQLLVLDTRDDRTEVWHLLHRLPPRDRVRFLVHACGMCPASAAGHIPAPLVWDMRTTAEQAYRCDRADVRLTNEVFADLLTCFAQWHLDAARTALALTEWVRRPELRRPRAPRAGASSSRPRSAPARTPCSTGSARPG